MKTLTAGFEIQAKSGSEYLVKYRVDTNEWEVYAARGGRFITSVPETRSHQFKNETRAKEILKTVLVS